MVSIDKPGETEAAEEDARGSSSIIVGSLSKVVGEISAFSDVGCGPLKRQSGGLVRRVKLLFPLFEELADAGGGFDGEAYGGLVQLRDALEAARELLKSMSEGSKIYQALEMENFVKRIQDVSERIEKALGEISYDKLDISEEVHERIELVHAQFRRAQERMDTPDIQLLMDFSSVRTEKSTDLAVLRRLSEKLQLKSPTDVKKESLALHEMVISNNGDPKDSIEEMSALLKKLNDWILVEKPDVDASEGKISLLKSRSLIIPDDFRCPISLELMKDPVIVSNGQTYERSCIQKWLDAGHKTCPKTQQNLKSSTLTPNFVLKSLIAQWCESNGIDLSKGQGSSSDKKSDISNSEYNRTEIGALLQRLAYGTTEQQRAAAGELRLLAKRNADNRVCIAEAGAIPLLVELLSSTDARTQEHAVTALLNLSIHENNKTTIVNAGAIPDIVEVLKNGSMEARENAAATLFSLSVADNNKVAIGAAGAIPPLIDLLCEGSPRGKKDAATAIFNLSIFPGNKLKAVRAGIVVHLMRLLEDARSGMVDEALAILAILAGHLEGKLAISQAEPIPVLVELVRTGSPRNRENAVSVLWLLCTGSIQDLMIARDVGVEEVLKELTDSGTDRAKRKAGNLLELLPK
ncbi:U-box domain-containing protein 12 [Acorus calamus]|uniref:RING-type E3 ubiquitin transferase n=1 Tax=Acorus calamus TaxID=4465 RepID=A0AAV9EK28_ACOCL|nr:U-box domain-containing protein 12 [Acorus calamus]